MMVVLLLAAAVAGVLGLLLLDAVVRRDDLAAALIFFTVVVAIAVPPSYASAVVGPFKIGLADVVFGLVLAAGILRQLRLRRWHVSQRLFAALAALTLLSLGRGLVLIDAQTAVNEFRTFLAFAGSGLYFSSFRGQTLRLERIRRYWLAAAMAVCAIVIVRWAMVLTGVQIAALTRIYDAPIRVLSGTETFFLASAAFLVVPRWFDREASRGERVMAVALLTIVTLLNRRTVWVAVIIGLGVLLLRRRGMGGRARPYLAFAGVVAVLVFFSRPDAAPSSVGQSATNSGTLLWRVEGWRSLLEDNGPRGPVEWLVGRPMGVGYERQVTTSTGATQSLETQPHSFYLQILLRAGLLGLAALVALFVVVLTRLRSAANRPLQGGEVLTAEALGIIVLMQVIWMLTWEAGIEHGLLVGLAAAPWWTNGSEANERAPTGAPAVNTVTPRLRADRT